MPLPREQYIPREEDPIFQRQKAEYCGSNFDGGTYFNKIRFAMGRGQSKGVIFTASAEDRAKLERFLQKHKYLDYKTCRVWQRAFASPKSGEVWILEGRIQIRCGIYIIFEISTT